MRIKRVKIGIKSVKDFLDDFVKTGEAIERGEKVKPEKGLYFEIIEEKQPESLQELSRLANRDMKSIVTDIKILESLDLIDMRRRTNGRRESTPTIDYERIDLQIAV